MKIAAISSIIFLFSITYANAASIEGKWAMKAAHCDYENGEQVSQNESVDGNITISGKTYEAYEGSCRIRSAKQSGSTWRLQLRCDSEGETSNSTVTIRLKDDNTAIFSQGGQMVRCR